MRDSFAKGFSEGSSNSFNAHGVSRNSDFAISESSPPALKTGGMDISARSNSTSQMYAGAGAGAGVKMIRIRKKTYW